MKGLTSPPPTTSTRLLRICQARISEPPPWIAGNSSDIVNYDSGRMQLLLFLVLARDIGDRRLFSPISPSPHLLRKTHVLE